MLYEDEKLLTWTFACAIYCLTRPLHTATVTVSFAFDVSVLFAKT